MDFKENTKPIYLQISDRICDDVMSGIYPPGIRIPSVREFAASVQVNANTVMRAYEHLSAKEIIFNKRGIGFFISPEARENIIKYRKETFFNSDINYFFSRLKKMQISPEELHQLYETYLNN